VSARPSQSHRSTGDHDHGPDRTVHAHGNRLRRRVPEPSETENAPKYRVLLGDEDGLDIGAGWIHVGERAGEFVSITIYSPLLGGTFRANLFRAGDDGSAWVLTTVQPSKKRQED
jgi:uncharacterized protein (DUF736 family)